MTRSVLNETLFRNTVIYLTDKYDEYRRVPNSRVYIDPQEIEGQTTRTQKKALRGFLDKLPGLVTDHRKFYIHDPKRDLDETLDKFRVEIAPTELHEGPVWDDQTIISNIERGGSIRGERLG